MYLWKCWRDTRGSFFIFLGALLAAGAYGAYVKFDPFGAIAAKPMESRFVWQGLANVLLNMTVELVPVAGFILGALGVGMEFEKGTADFLLTRPRARRRFLWTSWGLGAAQMIALALLSLAGNWLTRNASSPTVFGLGSVNVRLLAAMSVLALLCYTVTCLMTTLARNSRNGTALALVAISAYTALYWWLRLWYEIKIPIFWDLLERAARTAEFPFTAVVGWLTVCLALMFVAQFRLDRAEV